MAISFIIVHHLAVIPTIGEIYSKLTHVIPTIGEIYSKLIHVISTKGEI